MLFLKLSHLAGPDKGAGRTYCSRQPVAANHDFRPQSTQDLLRVGALRHTILGTDFAITRRSPPASPLQINSQFRVCFVWNDDGQERVEITDYH